MSGETLSNEDMQSLQGSGTLTPFEHKVREHSMNRQPDTKAASSVSKRKKDIAKQLENEVKTFDWKPSSILHHDKLFVQWINSMLYGSFKDAYTYKLYDLYKLQAENWLLDKTTIADFGSLEERTAWVLEEWDKCRDNTLYACCKYGYLHEGSDESGRRKVRPYEHQKVLLYLFDCGYSYMLGKGRQIGSTSIIGMAALFKTLLNRNYYIKFITEDTNTGEEIFVDKIKYPFNELPSFFRVNVKSDAASKFWLSSNKGKGNRGFPNSRIDMTAPSPTAANGGSPQLILVDEIGTIPVLGDMIREVRPTLYWKNPKTGVFEFKRQMVMWGTSGKMDKGKGDYLKEWSTVLSAWEDGDFSHGIVPLFFDWSTRVTAEEYEREKKFYYGGKRAHDLGLDLETSKIQFHQHYPTRWEDMFVTTLNTLIGRDKISQGLNVCRNLPEAERPQWGYFEPIYDLSKPCSHGDSPYKIIGATFMPVDDDDRVALATTLVRVPPVPGWKNRYYKGTDPISAATGKSKFSSTVYDAVTDEPCALQNSRTDKNQQYDFLQSMLLNLYYDTIGGLATRGIPELVESNIGQGYIDYVTDKGFDYFVYNAELPILLQGGTHIGIDNKSGTRNPNIIAALQNYVRDYWSKIKMELYWIQMETFVQVVGNNGASIWGPQNKKTHWDDTLFGLVYARICRLAFMDRTPEEQSFQHSNRVVKFKLKRNADLTLTRERVVETYTYTE